MLVSEADSLSPIPLSSRTLSKWDMAALWIGIVVNIPAYYLAGSLVELGMSWWQGIITIVVGNTITLFPLLLSGHPGTRYGISFPILLRAAFGVHGAIVPSLLRALAACGWCGIETWIGGQAIFLLLPASLTTHYSWLTDTIAWLGTSALEFSCFILFLLLQLAILWKGMPGIRALERYSTPMLILLFSMLFVWAYINAGGFGEMLSTPSRLTPSQFWSVFLPSLTASIGSWAGLALNISDFTRYCKTQQDQVVGQLGLPVFKGLFTFVGLAVTSSTEVIYDRVISNPVNLLATIGGPVAITLGILGISLATVTTNIPANFVAPANVLVSLNPSRFSFLFGCAVAGVIGIGFQPWRILGSSESYVYSWLVGYAGVLGPITGILLTDYYILRRTVLDVDGLYCLNSKGPYYYWHGSNVVALGVLVPIVVLIVPGFLGKVGMVREIPDVFVVIYDNGWFFGTFSAAFLYWLLSRGRKGSRTTAAPSLLDPLHESSSIVV